MRAAAHSALSVRPRREADDSFIVRLAQQAFTEYAPQAAGNTLRMARSGDTWLAVQAGEAVGFAVARQRGASRAELCAIAVEEHARGLGVGTALLVRLERALASAGFSELTLQTAQANVSALELFLKRGFHVEQRLPRYYRGVFDACTLRKRLVPVRNAR